MLIPIQTSMNVLTIPTTAAGIMPLVQRSAGVVVVLTSFLFHYFNFDIYTYMYI